MILRQRKHEVFKALLLTRRTSTSWFFDFKLHFIFNWFRRNSATRATTSGNLKDTEPVADMIKGG